MNDMNSNLFKNHAFPRVAPFILFMAFIALEQGLRFLFEKQLLDFDVSMLSWLYLPKAMLVGLMLWLCRQSYTEIDVNDFLDLRKTALSLFSGVLVFILWINMDWTFGIQSAPAGFDPKLFSAQETRWLMVAIRVAGAVIIVPVMEELFWRSFLLRYLINSDFTAVAIGRITVFSFLVVAILFGLEHHYVFAGIMAGVVFNFIYCITRSIAQCILSHAAANLGLAIYVLSTNQWRFW